MPYCTLLEGAPATPAPIPPSLTFPSPFPLSQAAGRLPLRLRSPPPRLPPLPPLLRPSVCWRAQAIFLALAWPKRAPHDPRRAPEPPYVAPPAGPFIIPILPPSPFTYIPLYIYLHLHNSLSPPLPTSRHPFHTRTTPGFVLSVRSCVLVASLSLLLHIIINSLVFVSVFLWAWTCGCAVRPLAVWLWLDLMVWWLVHAWVGQIVTFGQYGVPARPWAIFEP